MQSFANLFIIFIVMKTIYLTLAEKDDSEQLFLLRRQQEQEEDGQRKSLSIMIAQKDQQEESESLEGEEGVDTTLRTKLSLATSPSSPSQSLITVEMDVGNELVNVGEVVIPLDIKLEIPSSSSRAINGPFSMQFEKKKVDDLASMLFPNRTRIHGRELATRGRPAKAVPCIICQGLKTCSILNTLQIQEVYYPNNLELLGTCTVLEDLGDRMAKEIFGNGRTFRDSEQCRAIVMQYLCLFWGSDNDMYVNQCIYQEDVTSPNPVQHKVAPRPPCRSFCVQVAQVCAYDYNFLQLCSQIACPPTEDDCTPDPVVQGQVVSAGLACDIPYITDPYAPKSSAPSHQNLFGHRELLTVILVSALWILFGR